MNGKIIGVSALLASMAGCYIYDSSVYCPEEPVETVEVTTVIVETEEPSSYIDTYISLPNRIARLIAPYVHGYFSPSTSRYGNFLYYQEYPRTSDNLPCFVKADFNGDYINDYAFLFSAEEQYRSGWSLTTRLIVALSTECCHEVAVDVELGTVEADYSWPIEEYWSICVMPSGSRTYVAYENGAEITETVYLENDAFTVSFLETEERDLMFASGGEMFYMPWEPGSMAKKQALAKRSGGKKIIADWRGKVEKKSLGR
jgi:hypothetical protein